MKVPGPVTVWQDHKTSGSLSDDPQTQNPSHTVKTVDHDDLGLLCWACFHIPRTWIDLNTRKCLKGSRCIIPKTKRSNKTIPQTLQWGSSILVPDQEDYCYRGASPAIETEHRKHVGKYQKCGFKDKTRGIVECSWDGLGCNPCSQVEELHATQTRCS